MAGLATCPFCGIRHTAYMIQLHIGKYHSEGSSTSSEAESVSSLSSADVAGSSRSSVGSPVPGDRCTKCTRPGCGQYIMLSQVDHHLALHDAAGANDEEQPRRTSKSFAETSRSSFPSQTRRRAQTTDSRSVGLLRYFSGTSTNGRSAIAPSSASSINSSRSTQTSPRVKSLRQPQRPGRLGKRELGPYAFEPTMPDHVRRHLLNDARPRVVNRIRGDGRLEQCTIVPNETSGLIPILADLCAHDRSTATTYLCDPSVHHIRKIQCDGNFCGYWNIQVLLTYLRRHHPGLAGLREMPNILKIQEVIEQAWQNNICIYGKVETGGILGSRKWIGTHEALAYFTQIGVQVEAISFRRDENEKGGDLAAVALLDHVEAYFMRGLDDARSHGTSHITGLPPIYLQRFGHSMSIVGMERRHDGHRNLLVFDSSHPTSSAIERLLEGKRAQAGTDVSLEVYRRSDESLTRWEEFEIIS